MEASLTITIIGTVLTAIGTFVTIYYSFVVRKYKREISEELNRVDLIKVTESLKNAQNETRKIMYQISPNPHGRSKAAIINSIQKSIDDSLAKIKLDESNEELRIRIIEAQQALRDYVQANDSNKDLISEFHKLLQHCISIAKTNANIILGK
ncbi:MAG: hypothetical protein IH949_13385 [Bacteroidetes bacterium]|nr:hypothetical protein [Bacteroidota bacterium]